MLKLKTALIVIICVLIASVAVLLLLVNARNSTIAEMTADASDLSDTLIVLAAERNLFHDSNTALLAREDSLASVSAECDTLRAYADGVSLINTYYGHYLIIDTNQNRFHLRRRFRSGHDLMIRTGYCGTGKGLTVGDSLTWDFSTPTGVRYVSRTIENPLWYRPDWYWLERGLEPPTPDSIISMPDSLTWEEEVTFYNDSLSNEERLLVVAVPGALGNYSLSLGGGILIHYGVGLGRNSSHGCIRMGSEDLEAIYQALPVGSPVIIY